MSGFKLNLLLFIGYVSIFPLQVYSTHSVPVYLWETSQFSEIVPALASLEQPDFKKIIADRSTVDPLLVFTEETLSPEDFALRDSDGIPIFGLISSLKSTVHTTYWPLVKSPITAVTELLKKNIVKTSIKELQDNLNFSIQDNDVVIVDLKDAMDDEDRLEMLKRHDKAIMEIYQRFAKTNENIITILTSYHSSWIVSEELRSKRKARAADNTQVVKAENSNKIYTNKDLLIYVTSAAVLNFKGHSYSLKDFELAPESQVFENSINVTMNSITPGEFSLVFNFLHSRGYWSLHNIIVKNHTGDEYSLWVKDVYAPVGFSYHCHAQMFYNLSNSDINLTLPGFQIQLYFNTTEGVKHRFGEAYDCVGFTTAPIWSGLFVTFIMALIMTFGLSMMMDIKTMDRFDDPKGKTITTNVSE